MRRANFPATLARQMATETICRLKARGIAHGAVFCFTVVSSVNAGITLTTANCQYYFFRPHL